MRLPLLDAFLDRGFTYFDTALTYHGFRSEEFVRRALVERHARSEYAIATKLPPRVLKSAEDQERLFGEQLERMGVDYFDYYLIHNLGVSAYKQAQAFATFEFVMRKKREGKIRNVGISFHDTPELLDEILRGHPDLDFVQLQINYIDWENPGISVQAMPRDREEARSPRHRHRALQGRQLGRRARRSREAHEGICPRVLGALLGHPFRRAPLLRRGAEGVRRQEGRDAGADSPRMDTAQEALDPSHPRNHETVATRGEHRSSRPRAGDREPQADRRGRREAAGRRAPLFRGQPADD
jgi:hypothetical protein